MKNLDCKVDWKSFSLEIDKPSPEINKNCANIMETRGSRTTCESRTAMYKCKNHEKAGKHKKVCTLLCRYG